MAIDGRTVLRGLKDRIGEKMLHNALNTDPSEARSLLGEDLARKIEVRIAGGASAIAVANDFHLDISPDDVTRWAAFYRIAAERIAARENARCVPAALPATI